MSSSCIYVSAEDLISGANHELFAYRRRTLDASKDELLVKMNADQTADSKDKYSDVKREWIPRRKNKMPFHRTALTRTCFMIF